ncbi:MAG: hypothetical protein BMS9Abin37_2840 [Acidobacteriota bacterium]|nr:MAG: hypothetical protein BMS9Abin37_2840 [Acidobacteriota bacterium]
MVSIPSLWLPILVSAILVFVTSSIIHMFLPYHRSDFAKVPSEDDVMDALRKFDIPPGEYVIPYAGSPEVMRSEEFQAKAKKGPVAFVNFREPGLPAMGASLAQWFIYSILVGVFAAYITGRVLGPGAEYMSVFRFAGTTAFLCYAVALWQNSIWYKRAWSTTAKSTFDGLVYALVTAGAFGWLWPS